VLANIKRYFVAKLALLATIGYGIVAPIVPRSDSQPCNTGPGAYKPGFPHIQTRYSISTDIEVDVDYRQLFNTVLIFVKAISLHYLSYYFCYQTLSTHHVVLDLRMETFPGDVVSEKTSTLLRRYLQPDSTLKLTDTAKSILDPLPEDDLKLTKIWCFGELCIKIAEQIPYHHPSQLKFAALLEHLGKSSKLGMTGTSGWYNQYQLLG